MKVREFFRCDRCKEEGFGELECSYIRIRDTKILKNSKIRFLLKLTVH